jgi:oligosaccharide repeat unit polymerase
MIPAAVAGSAAALIAIAILVLGRLDLTRPAVTFGVVWFAFVALAQLRLTRQESPWPTGFTLLVFAGALVFIAASLLAGGTAPARGRISVRRDDYDARRLVLVALVLVAGGAIGAAYKAHVLGGVPLLSGDADVLRARAYRAGRSIVPAWSSMLTNGFYLGMWCTLAALWIRRRDASRRALAGLLALAGVAFFGVALEASRNLVLFALAVPGVALYLLVPPARGRERLVRPLAAVAIVALVVGGGFALRLWQADTTSTAYLDSELRGQPAMVRPFLPLYINGVFPLEAEHRLYLQFPAREPYKLGAYTLLSLPDATFPEGKRSYGSTLTQLMEVGVAGGGLAWNVATYQGRMWADLGWTGVILGSLLLGLGFGRLYRWGRSHEGLLAVAVVAYVAYYSGFMIYDNLLSFTLIGVYDLAAILVVERYARGDELVAPVVRLARRAAPG